MKHGEGKDVAEQLYIQYQLSFDEIAARIGRCEKTVRLWADEGGWREKRQAFIRTQLSTHERLYDLVNKLIDKAQQDLESGDVDVGVGRLHAINNLSKSLKDMYRYEDDRVTKRKEEERSERQQSGGLSDDILQKLEKQLGIL
jgi:hypothetical protein